MVSHLFWMGDLNYRISLPDVEVRQFIQLGLPGIEKLLTYDQLLAEKTAKRSFAGFMEAPIDFPPTYKYDVGTNRFDSRYSYKRLILQ
jgi:hypothetical protein